MSLFHIKDYGLTPAQLQIRHERKGSHPGYPQPAWRTEVALGNTERGYWDWVCAELESEADELERDSPYHTELEEE